MQKEREERARPPLAPELLARVRQIQIRTHELVSELLHRAEVIIRPMAMSKQLRLEVIGPPDPVEVVTDPSIGAPDSEAWWDVPVSEVAELESTRGARAQYEQDKRTQKHYLSPGERVPR